MDWRVLGYRDLQQVLGSVDFPGKCGARQLHCLHWFGARLQVDQHQFLHAGGGGDPTSILWRGVVILQRGPHLQTALAACEPLPRARRQIAVVEQRVRAARQIGNRVAGIRVAGENDAALGVVKAVRQVIRGVAALRRRDIG